MIDDGSLYTVDQVKAALTKLRAAQQAVEAQHIGIVDGGHYTIATRLKPYWLQTIFSDYDPAGRLYGTYYNINTATESLLQPDGR